MTTKKYMPCCLVCYTTHLTPKPVGTREANRIACSHQNIYHHDVTIIEHKKEATDA